MIKKVGITVDILNEESYWRQKHSSLKMWDVVRANITYEQAVHIKGKYEKRGYQGSGSDKRVLGAVCSVYIFEI